MTDRRDRYKYPLPQAPKLEPGAPEPTPEDYRLAFKRAATEARNSLAARGFAFRPATEPTRP